MEIVDYANQGLIAIHNNNAYWISLPCLDEVMYYQRIYAEQKYEDRKDNAIYYIYNLI